MGTKPFATVMLGDSSMICVGGKRSIPSPPESEVAGVAWALLEASILWLAPKPLRQCPISSTMKIDITTMRVPMGTHLTAMRTAASGLGSINKVVEARQGTAVTTVS
jgi:hypothetical protein